MTTALSEIVLRARGMSVSNNDPTMTGNTDEMITAIAAWERDIFRAAAIESRFFATTAILNSSAGSANRTLDLSALTPPVERLIVLNSPTAAVHRVDLEDQAAELAPRFYQLGQNLYEIGSEWGAPGALAMTVAYAMAPAPLDPTGNLSQTLTLPDDYTDLVVLRLAHYLAVKDTGRDPVEAQGLQASYDKRFNDAIARLDHFAGPARRRFLSPERLPGGSE